VPDNGVVVCNGNPEIASGIDTSGIHDGKAGQRRWDVQWTSERGGAMHAISGWTRAFSCALKEK
jgi:hypothetical protein